MKILWEPEHFNTQLFRDESEWKLWASNLNKPTGDYFYDKPEKYPCLLIIAGHRDNVKRLLYERELGRVLRPLEAQAKYSTRMNLEATFIYDFEILDEDTLENLQFALKSLKHRVGLKESDCPTCGGGGELTDKPGTFKDCHTCAGCGKVMPAMDFEE